MRLKHDWQVESWALRKEGGERWSCGMIPLKRVSLSDKSSRRPSQNDPVCVSGRHSRGKKWMKEIKGRKIREHELNCRTTVTG